MATMEPVLELAAKYRSEFEETINGLRQRSLTIGQAVQEKVTTSQQQFESVQPQINAKKEELLQTLQNMEPVAKLQHKSVMETFAWAGVLNTGSFVGGILGSVFLSSLIGLFFDTFPALLLAYVFLPVMVFAQ
uniref:Restin n=1 Tax=Steinernema glaseri TaxID=37863 RepID=A0A1I7YJ82_9BILA